MWVGVPAVVWFVILPLVMMPATLASSHHPVLMYWPHLGRSPHIAWRGEMCKYAKILAHGPYGYVSICLLL